MVWFVRIQGRKLCNVYIRMAGWIFYDCQRVYVSWAMYCVPENSPDEDKAICNLLNQGLDSRQLFCAATTFYKLEVEERLRRGENLIVESGLFHGLWLYPGYIGSQILPKIQGTYEKEVQDFLLKTSDSFDHFLNVGCAEGFYLAGIARWKKIPCMGIDTDNKSREAVEFVGQKNNVRDLISFSEKLTEAQDFIEGKLACLIDVDGSEEDVLFDLCKMFSEAIALRSVLLFVESDSAGKGRQNYHELISSLIHDGWFILSLIHQDPNLRFVGSKSHLSFLDQIVHGWEGRPGAQCWIVATKNYSSN